MKRTVVIFFCLIIVVVLLFFAIRSSSYDNSQSQCEHYKDSQKQQQNIDKELKNK